MIRYFNEHIGAWYSFLIHLAIFSALLLFSTRSILKAPIYLQVAEINLAIPPKKTNSPAPLEKVKPASSDAPATHQPQPRVIPLPATPKENIKPMSVAPEITTPSKEADAGYLKNEPAKEVHENAIAPAVQQATPQQATVTEPQRPGAVTLSEQAQPITKVPSEAAESAGAWGLYGKNLSQACTRFRRYPAAAIASGMRGTVYVAIRIRADGGSEVVIRKSSGVKMLDDEAVSMVTQASKVVAVPDILKNKTRELVIPIGFEL